MNEFKCRGNLTTICDDEDDNQHDHDYHDDHHGQWLTKSHEKDFWFPLNHGFRFRALQTFEQTKSPFNIKMFIFCQLWQGNRCQNKRSLWKAEVPRGKKGKKRLNLFGPTSTKRGGNQYLSVARLQNRSFYTECQGTHSWALPQYTLCPGNWFVQVRCVPSSLDEV